MSCLKNNFIKAEFEVKISDKKVRNNSKTSFKSLLLILSFFSISKKNFANKLKVSSHHFVIFPMIISSKLFLIKLFISSSQRKDPLCSGQKLSFFQT